MDQAALRRHLKELIIRVCDVKSVKPEQVDDDAVLFAADGPLDLTSLDAIEIAIAIEREYKVKMKNMSSARDYFRSIATLADYIAAQADPAQLQRFQSGAQG
ncbi:MAG: acyl carrier protein [Deltaproteobacteria bacterium]|nr:acyl carrier protein [Deltaproteobacteria bacterium]